MATESQVLVRNLSSREAASIKNRMVRRSDGTRSKPYQEMGDRVGCKVILVLGKHQKFDGKGVRSKSNSKRHTSCGGRSMIMAFINYLTSCIKCCRS